MLGDDDIALDGRGDVIEQFRPVDRLWPWLGRPEIERVALQAVALVDRITGRARSTWQKARLIGTGPPFIRLGRLVRYRSSEFNAWLSAHPSLRSTSDVVEAKLEDETRDRGRVFGGRRGFR
jgi:hypothetical protein